ncbi:MAG: hypothetical protein AAFO69_13910, partial [Bacteroidota bacterium]
MKKEKNKRKKNFKNLVQGSTHAMGLVAVLFMFLFLTGCVSNTKYMTTQDELAEARKAYEEEKERRMELEKEKKTLATMQEFVINSQDEMIMQKAKKIDSLKEITNNRTAKLKEVKNTLDNLKKENFDIVQMEDRLLIELQDQILFKTGSDDISDRGEAVIQDISSLVVEQLDNDVKLWIV